MVKYFDDLGKKLQDLFDPKDKGYDLKQPTVEVKTKVADPDAEVTTKFEVENGELTASVEDKLKLPKYGLTVKAKVNTKKDPSVEVSNDSLVDGLTIIGKTELLKTFKFTGKYAKDIVAFRADVEVNQAADKDGDSDGKADEDGDGGSEVILTPSVVVSLNDINLGASAVLKPSADDVLDNYDLGLEYTRNALVVTGKVADKLSKIQIGGAYQVNDKVLFGAAYEVQSGDFSKQGVCAGGTYDFNENASIKVKANSSGIVNAIFKQRLSAQTSLSFSTQFDATNIRKEETQKLGIKLVLGDS